MTESKNNKGQISVLYIEDNEANLRLVTQILARVDGVSVVGEMEPENGLALASELAPDLILLDINLPGMSGFEVLSKLRENPATTNIKVYALSANAMQSDIDKAMSAGFDDYITKPINVMNFIQKMKMEVSANKAD